MVTLLRKIRSSLIEAGSAKRYFLYAIGEIFLVVIGILIALQINNLNELGKDHDQYIKYIQGLISDVQSDVEALDRNERGNVKYRMAARNILNIHLSDLNFEDIEFESHEGVTKADTLRLLISIQQASFMAAPLINKFTIEDIQSSGNTSIFKNDSLKREIFNYYSRLEEFQEWWQGKLRAKYAIDEVKFTLLDPILLNLINHNEVERKEIMSNFNIDPTEIVTRIRNHEDLVPTINKMIYTRERISIENEWRIDLAQNLKQKLENELSRIE